MLKPRDFSIPCFIFHLKKKKGLRFLELTGRAAERAGSTRARLRARRSELLCFFSPCALVHVCTIQGDPRSYSLTAPTDPAARARLGRPRAPSVHDTPRPELRELTEMCTVGHNTWATQDYKRFNQDFTSSSSFEGRMRRKKQTRRGRTRQTPITRY